MKNKGFTLIEILIVIVILGVLVLAFVDYSSSAETPTRTYYDVQKPNMQQPETVSATPTSVSVCDKRAKEFVASVTASTATTSRQEESMRTQFRNKCLEGEIK